MKKLGIVQSLEVLRFTSVGAYLNATDESSDTDVLLPTRYVPDDVAIGDMLDVFLYRDSEDRLITTTEKPMIQVGQIGVLKVVDTTQHGAFLAWGLTKDLFLPFKEQTRKVVKGDKLVVMLYEDLSGRLSATMRISSRLTCESDYKAGDKVMGTVYQNHPQIGLFVAVDGLYHGLIPRKEVFGNLSEGDDIEARVTFVKPDGKLDLAVREKVEKQIFSDVDVVFDLLKQHGGQLPYNDYSDPEEVKTFFKMSKRAFKRATGVLLKEGKIDLTPDGMKIK